MKSLGKISIYCPFNYFSFWKTRSWWTCLHPVSRVSTERIKHGVPSVKGQFIDFSGDIFGNKRSGFVGVQTYLHSLSVWQHMDRRCSARSTPRPVQSAAHLYFKTPDLFYSVALRRRPQLCNDSESSNQYGSFFFMKHLVFFLSYLYDQKEACSQRKKRVKRVYIIFSLAMKNVLFQ